MDRLGEVAMQIPSAFNAGVEGYLKAQQGVAEASNAIAREPVRQQQSAQLEQGAESNPSTQQLRGAEQSSAPQTDRSLTDELVRLRVEERNAQASAKVIETADEVVGTLIDTTA